MVQSNGLHCRENGAGFHDNSKDFGTDLSALRRNTSIEVVSFEEWGFCMYLIACIFVCTTLIFFYISNL